MKHDHDKKLKLLVSIKRSFVKTFGVESYAVIDVRDI